MRLDHAFSIPIVRKTIDPDIIENSLNLVNNYVTEKNVLNNPLDKGQLLTTFYETKDFLGKINDRPMLDTINRNVREYLNLIGWDPQCFVEITSWLQLYPPESYFYRHDHYGALVSGVVYLDAPENSGNIIFHNPLEPRRATQVFFERTRKEENQYNFNHVEYTPVKGEMLLFESWLPHSVAVNKSNENRIAVAFNIWVDKDGKS